MYLLFQRAVAVLLLILLIPLFAILYLLVKLTSKGPFLFTQIRAGKNKKPFVIYKIRTMYEGAQNHQKKYEKINQADGPVFKIRYDPRFTKIGTFLAYSGLDELPQLVNIIRSEMAFVGPRPLPIEEAIKISKKYQKRFTVLPGITSSWVIQGAHRLSFDQWMKLDVEYVSNKSIRTDLYIAIKTVGILFKSTI